MKCVLVLGNSLNGAFNEYVNRTDGPGVAALAGLKFEFLSINGRAFTRHAVTPPFEHTGLPAGTLRLLPTSTPQDGPTDWYPGARELRLSDYDGIVVNETLLWTMFPHVFGQGFFVPGFLREVPECFGAISAGRMPLSESAWLEMITAFKCHSLELFRQIRKAAPALPVLVAPCALPREDQTDFDLVFRAHRAAEITCLGAHLQKQFNVLVGQQPAHTLASLFATKAEFTKGDIHHYNADYVGACFRSDSFERFLGQVRSA